jgi:hypothetical protein
MYQIHSRHHYSQPQGVVKLANCTVKTKMRQWLVFNPLFTWSQSLLPITLAIDASVAQSTSQRTFHIAICHPVMPNRWTSPKTLSAKSLGDEIAIVEAQFDEHVDGLNISDRDSESSYLLE